MEACEDIAGTLFICELYERHHVKVVSEDDQDISQKVVNRIPNLYAAILELSFHVKKHLRRDKVCMYSSPFLDCRLFTCWGPGRSTIPENGSEIYFQ